MLSRKNLLRSVPLALAAVTALTLTGCGSDSASDESTPDASLSAGDLNVQFNGDEPPTLTLPADKPDLAETKITVVAKGDGATVGPNDQVTLEYQGTSWDTGEIFDQSYGRAPATFAPSQVIPGFAQALVGQQVGSKVLAEIPPKDAYGPAGSGSELAGQTLVFLVDIKSVN
ncbi:peptidylprolyl isomerase [Rhodococcus tukisamuensis]|uniref:Peptidyl-prolyl cis-trans isomerase n=2 Tax=Rhodococcus tukisamuensis TaxID=168276 RepID=A0A1G7AET6_9NOCA|nr:FKBP-type peptidyl-prolyl cis-trans isomerase [Rhodococcus tukisamuensis]SDE13280.1 peptidylprolyl isomerase [Rhodococcus tukisamuensis]